MSIVTGDVLKVVQKINLPNSVEAINVFYFEADFQADQTESDCVDALEVWVEAFYADLATIVSSAVSLGEMPCYVRGGSPDYAWTLIGTATPSVTFSNITEMLPHGVAAIIRGYTERSTTIARKYIPGICEDQQAGGAWSSGCITALTNAADEWQDNAALDGSNRLYPGSPSTVTNFFYELTGEFVIPSEPAYQRRRRPGTGT